MKAPLLLVLLLTIAYHTEGNCADDSNEYLYGCKAKEEEGQDLSCTCMKLQQKGKFNCTCDDQVEIDEHYLDCNDALKKGERESGVYLLKPDNMEPFEAYCDMETDGGGWTVFQRRMDGSVNFYLNWDDYVHGFGNLSEEHWLGLSKLHRLAIVSRLLRVDMKGKDDVYRYATYSSFYIGDPSTDYTLHISGFSTRESSGVQDALAYHNGCKFTTKDNDNDKHPSINCAVSKFGAWWYNGYHKSNLNGHYGAAISSDDVYWHPMRIRFAEMKFRAE